MDAKRHSGIYLLAGAFAAASLSLFPALAQGSLLGQRQTWEFMQRVGGITIGTPVRKNPASSLSGPSWSLPVNCDVSGFTKFTVKPTLLNSGLAWADTKVEIEDGQIYITIETGVITVAGKSPLCGPADLGSIKDGSYPVFYMSPDGSKHAIGKAEIRSSASTDPSTAQLP
ncbi:MAG TPA: hypothetical protein VGH91_05600 [Gammaproteobacteria bacterium]|jgi:hypothetical protein